MNIVTDFLPYTLLIISYWLLAQGVSLSVRTLSHVLRTGE